MNVRHFIVLIGILISLSTHAQKKYSGQFVLKGNFSGKKKVTLLLNYRNVNNLPIEDTAYPNNGYFIFKGNIDEPTLAILSDIHTNSVEAANFARIFLEPGNMTIKLTENNFNKAQFTGSYTQQQWDSLQLQLKPIMDVILPLNSRYVKLRRSMAKGDSSVLTRETLSLVEDSSKTFRERLNNKFYHFTWRHPGSYLSAYILSDFVNINELSPDSAKMYYFHLSPQIRNSRPGVEVFKDLKAQNILVTNKSEVGNKAPLFSLRDTENKVISLSSYKKRNYVLLDFWATWCAPCQKAIPILIKSYQQYHSKGLTIIGMSWDYNKTSLLTAIKKENIKWQNIFLNKMEQRNFLSEQYGIASIPSFILINRNGIIIARLSSPVALKRKLYEIFE